MADYAIHEETLTGIADVIRKKDGTSALIDPADYADRINLMGMLEEKTVSGTIAHFEDGADAVPLKGLKAQISPSLDSVDSVTISHAGKNLFNKNDITENTGIEVNATTTTTLMGYKTTGFIPVKANTRYWVTGKESNRSAYYTKKGEGIAYFSFSGGASFQALYDGYIRITIKDTVSLDTFIVAEGSEAPVYEGYSGDTYTIDIPNPNPNLRPSADVDEGQWNTDGTIHTSSGGSWYRAFTMAVSEKTTYDIYGLLDDLIVYLDSNKTMLSYDRLSNTPLSLQNERKTTPANCAYIGLTALSFDVSSVSVKESFLVYGGSIDVVNGDGSETWEKKVYTGRNDEYWVLSKTGDIYRYYVINDNAKQPTGRGVVYSSIGQYSASGNEVGTCFTYYSSGINRVLIYYIPPQTIQTVEDFRTWLSSNNFDVVYEKATAEPFSVPQIAIDSKAGTNNIWNDSGDTDVTYRSQGTAYIYPEGEGVSF